MNLTKEEKQLIIQKRTLEQAKKPIKIGYLKQALYMVDNNVFDYDSWHYSFDEKKRRD